MVDDDQSLDEILSSIEEHLKNRSNEEIQEDLVSSRYFDYRNLDLSYIIKGLEKLGI